MTSNITNGSENDYRQALEFAIGVPFTDGNRIKALHNGDAIFPEMLEAIRAANTTIDFVTFVYWQGDIAEKFAEALAERSRAGITVRVLLDAFGARLIKDDVLNNMLESSVEVRWFRPLSTWRLWRSDKRTHRKILVCDNQVGFTGGVGIADEWCGDARNSHEWRDSHYLIQGPALIGLRAAFLDNWNEAGDWVFESPPAMSKYEVEQGLVAMQMVRASTTIGWTDISVLVRTLISVARQRILIATAYFSPDETLVDMLCEASGKGIQVTVLTAGSHTDSRLSQLSGQRSYERLLESNVEIYRYQESLLHSKLMLVDDQVSCIGSANINHRSLSKDEECCLVALSTKFNQDSALQFELDCKDSEKLLLDEWRNRGLQEKFFERCAALLVEQL